MPASIESIITATPSAASNDAFPTIAILLLFAAVFAFLSPSAKSNGIPRVGKNPLWSGLTAAKRDFTKNGAHIIDQGYKSYGNTMFLVQTADMERIVLSPRYLQELISLPEEVLSLREGMSQVGCAIQTPVLPRSNELSTYRLPLREETLGKLYWVGHYSDEPFTKHGMQDAFDPEFG